MSASQRQDRERLVGFEIEMVKLVRKGATSKQWREWLRAPLEHAAADGNMELFTRLMDAGADGSAGWRGCHGQTLLGAAARGKSEEIVLALVMGGARDDVDVQFGKTQESALHVAATKGAEGASRALLYGDADPNVVDSAGRSPLHVTAHQGHRKTMDHLLFKGANPNAQTRNENTPLHVAAWKGWDECVSTLLDKGAEKDSRNGEGETPLYLAARGNKLKAVEALLGKKADPDIRACNGCRPLDIAAHGGSSDVLEYLLERNAGDVKACDFRGYTALHHAADLDGPDCDNSGAVGVLRNHGAEIGAKATGDQYKTPLHLATCRRSCSSGTLCALLEGEADVNARDAIGCTPLHYACRYSNVGSVDLLLRWGADETLLDEGGDSVASEVGMWGILKAKTKNARPMTSSFATCWHALQPTGCGVAAAGWCWPVPARTEYSS